MAAATNPVQVELTNNTGFPRRYTCADTAITKNSFLTLSDPRTAAATSSDPAAGGVCGGIASMAKEVDGSTSITAWTDGVFDARASGAIGVGEPVQMAGAGEIMLARLAASGAVVIGYALETASDQEYINFRLRI